jgi:hypothetical protein
MYCDCENRVLEIIIDFHVLSSPEENGFLNAVCLYVCKNVSTYVMHIYIYMDIIQILYLIAY